MVQDQITVIFKVLILMLTKKEAFWDVTPRRKLISYRSFGRLYWLHIQVQALFLYCLTLNMDHYAPRKRRHLPVVTA